MIRPVKRTILQTVGNVSCDSGWEIFDFHISESGIFKPADVEAELENHRLEASNSQLHISVPGIDSIFAGTVIADKEI